MGVPEKLAERMTMAEQHEYLRAKFSRRNMIRGGAVTLGAVAGGAFVPGAVAQAAAPTQATTSSTEKVDGALVAPSAVTSPSATTRVRRSRSPGRFRPR